MIVTFCAEGRWQQAKRAGGRQAAEAGHHRAQRARIGGNAHAHRQARGAHRGRELLDAVESASSARTRMKFTETEVRITVSEVSCALKASTNARQSTRHTPSVVAGPVRLWRACAQECRSHPSVGSRHRGHGAAYFFRQPLEAVRTPMIGPGAVRRRVDAARHGEREEENQPPDEPSMMTIERGTRAVGVGSGVRRA